MDDQDKIAALSEEVELNIVNSDGKEEIIVVKCGDPVFAGSISGQSIRLKGLKSIRVGPLVARALFGDGNGVSRVLVLDEVISHQNMVADLKAEAMRFEMSAESAACNDEIWRKPPPPYCPTPGKKTRQRRYMG